MADDYFRILPVFLASPGDLVEERKIARRVVKEVNMVGREIGWRVELLGWEDTLPGSGRPQELINRDCDACRLFIGMLHRRWGQPTGEYSSGFEEEFIRARSRTRETGGPELWLFFKEIEAEQLADPGEQLRKVLTFRQEQIAAREIFFKEFADEHDWEQQFRQNLSRYLLRLSQSAHKNAAVAAETSPSSPPSSGESAAELPAVPSESSEPTYRQPAELVSLLGDIASGQLDELESVYEDETIFKLIRLFLLSHCYMSKLYASDFPNTHDINYAYKYRRRIELTRTEKATIGRYLFGDTSVLRPGWYWLNKWTTEDISKFLFTLAATDELAVAKQCLARLINAQIMPTPDVIAGDLLWSIMARDLVDVKTVFLKYLADMPVPDRGDMINMALQDSSPEVRRAAQETDMLVNMDTDPNAAFLKMIDWENTPSNQILNKIRDQRSVLLSESLHKGLKSAHKEIRMVAAEELLIRDAFSVDEIMERIKESPADVLATFYKYLLSKGVKISVETIRQSFPQPKSLLGIMDDYYDPTDLIHMSLRQASMEELKEMSDYYSMYAVEAYRVLVGKFFADVESRIRADLFDKFESFRQESGVRFAERYGVTPDKEWDKLTSWRRSALIGAALSALAQHGEKSDVRFVEAYADDKEDEVKIGCIDIVSKCGGEDHVGLLFRIAKDGSTRIKEAAGRAAVVLAPGIGKATKQLLESGDSTYVRVAAEALVVEESGKTREDFQKLLLSENDEVRLVGVAYLVGKLTAEELEDVLETYLSGSYVWYAVTCWLDRCLYAPGPLRDLFRKELFQKVFGRESFDALGVGRLR